MMMSTLTRMTLISLVDDPAVNNTYSEFLLRVLTPSPGLPQGSRQTGLAVPRGNILMTSNEMETERYIYSIAVAYLFRCKILCCKKSYII